MAHTVTHQPEKQRYVIFTDDDPIGLTQYRVDGDTIVFVHTEIDPDKQEKGLAGQLVQFALDDVRASSASRVVAQCSYVAHWISEHPDYQDLLDR